MLPNNDDSFKFCFLKIINDVHHLESPAKSRCEIIISFFILFVIAFIYFCYFFFILNKWISFTTSAAKSALRLWVDLNWNIGEEKKGILTVF